jgi:hypothetical protein
MPVCIAMSLQLHVLQAFSLLLLLPLCMCVLVQV